MRNIYLIARHDLRLTLKDHSAWLWIFLFPLIFAVFFGLVFGGGGSNPAEAKAMLALVNEDEGGLSRFLLAELGNERLQIEEITRQDLAGGEKKARVLFVPSDFTDRVLRGDKTTLELVKDPEASPEAALMAQSLILKAAARFVGGLVELENKGELDLAGDLKEWPSLAKREDLVRVESRYAGKAKITPGGFAQSIPGNAVMFVMLVALVYGAASLAYERTSGVLRRISTLPVSRLEIVSGKIAGRFAVAAVQVVVYVGAAAAARELFGLYPGESTLNLLAVLLVFALVVSPLGILLGAYFKDPDHAANLGVVATIVMAALGGCWWPQEILSEPFKAVALIVPTGWAMKALHQVISFGAGLGEVVPLLLVMLAYAAAFTFAAARSLRSI